MSPARIVYPNSPVEPLGTLTHYRPDAKSGELMAWFGPEGNETIVPAWMILPLAAAPPPQ